MQLIKRSCGVVWMIAGVALMALLFRIAVQEMSNKPQIDTWIQWIVFLIVFIPILAGFIIFGYYAVTGEYDNI
ncbi:MAG: hypothetical protein QM664_10960 [Flavihumibacter sp.]